MNKYGIWYDKKLHIAFLWKTCLFLTNLERSGRIEWNFQKTFSEFVPSIRHLNLCNPKACVGRVSRCLWDGETGRSCRDAACVLGAHHSNFSEYQNQPPVSGRFEDHPWTGQPRVTTEARINPSDGAIFEDVSRREAVTLGTHEHLICPDTVERHLRDHGLTSHRPFRGQILSMCNF